jgi:hypothetical protein
MLQKDASNRLGKGDMLAYSDAPKRCKQDSFIPRKYILIIICIERKNQIKPFHKLTCQKMTRKIN